MVNGIIMDMLEKNPAKRLGATQLLKKYYQDGKPVWNSSPENGLLQPGNNINNGPAQVQVQPQTIPESKTNNFFQRAEHVRERNS